jgi:hypothetical protein
VNRSKIKRFPLTYKIIAAFMMTILIVTGSVAVFGWFSDMKIQQVDQTVARLNIGIEKAAGDTWLYNVVNGEVNAAGGFALMNRGDRETFMRVGVIPTWLDEQNRPIGVEADAAEVMQSVTISAPNNLKIQPSLYSAALMFDGAEYEGKKTFIRLMDTESNDYALVPSAQNDSIKIICQFQVRKTSGIPDNAKYLRLSFVPEAIQATEDALAYVRSKTNSGLNAPW